MLMPLPWRIYTDGRGRVALPLNTSFFHAGHFLRCVRWAKVGGLEGSAAILLWLAEVE